MKSIDQISSKLDATVKHIYSTRDQIIEFSYINKNDGKDIICAPTQSSCGMGCHFCFLTGSGFPTKNLRAEEIVQGVSTIVDGLQTRRATLLVSFMGSGEPLLNQIALLDAAVQIKDRYAPLYASVRFAVASIVPHTDQLDIFTTLVERSRLPVKFHLSLHSPNPEKRKAMMPNSGDILESVTALTEYRRRTGNPIEIHYTLIAGINDFDSDIVDLAELLMTKSIPVKFLDFKEKTASGLKSSNRFDDFNAHLRANYIETELYIPPGADIGASCGQFLYDTDKSRYLRVIR